MYLKNKTEKLHIKARYILMFWLALIVMGICRVIFVKADDGNARLYALRVETAQTSGKEVGSFVIVYTDSQGATRRSYINPNDGDYQASIDMAAEADKGSLSKRAVYIEDAMGYTVQGTKKGTVDSQQALLPNSTNTYFFTTYYDVKSIEAIGVMSAKTKTESKEWDCYGISLYKVDTINGFVTNGFISSSLDVDFSGTLLETMEYKNSSSTKSLAAEFRFSKNGIVYLYNNQLKELPGGHTSAMLVPQNTHVGGMTSTSNEYTIKIDIADVYKAGFESYTRDSKEHAKLSGFKPAEILVLKIDYTTPSKALKSAYIPVMASTIGHAMEKGIITKDTAIADLLPQGGSLAFTVDLPEFEKIHEASLTYINSEASLTELVGFKSVTGTEHSKYYESTKSDTIAISGIQIYKGNAVNVSMSNGAKSSASLNVKTKADAQLLYYVVAPGQTGMVLHAGVTESLTFRKAESQKAMIKPEDKRNLYLVEVKTSMLKDAGTTSDVEAIIKYFDKNDEEKRFDFRFKEAFKSFYGYWPDASGEDAGYNLCMKNGAVYYALIEMDSVKRIYGISLNNKGKDAWITDGVAIYKVTDNSDIGTITYRWNNVAGEAGVIHGREVKGHLIDFETDIGEILKEDGERKLPYVAGLGTTDLDNKKNPEKPTQPVDPENPDDPGYPTEPGRPVTDEEAQGIYIAGEKGKDIDFDSVEVSKLKDVRTNIFEYMYDMPYDIARTEFGFDSKRVAYTVKVTVGSLPYGIGVGGNKYDDCGSRNFFYFQLVFEKGTSAYVQGNQQLKADSFRSGRTEEFMIYVNQEYGELKSINIIPETDMEIGDPYDKLKIDKIAVTRTTDNGYTQTYETNELKDYWIGIDYIDSGATEKKLTAAQLERSIPIAKELNSADIMFAIGYDSLPEELEQFKGTVYATINYKKTDGTMDKDEIDVAQYMHIFNGTDGIALDSEKTMPDGTSYLLYSDPSLMFRPNHTDRFLWTAHDIKYIDSIVFEAMNTTDKEVGLYISNISMQVLKAGRSITTDRAMNHSGEYIIENADYTDAGYSLEKKQETFSPGDTRTIMIQFDNDESTCICESVDNVKPFVVTKTPVSENDTVNIYAFVADGSSDLNTFDVHSTVYFEDHRNTERYTRNKLGLTTIEDENGVNRQAFFCEGLPVKNFSKLKFVELKATGTGNDLAIDYIYIQHIRNNVVIENLKAVYTFPGVSIKNATIPTTGIVALDDSDDGNNNNNKGYQEVTIQLGQNMDKANTKTLVHQLYDLAVSLDYQFVTGDGVKEYHTENVFLSDMNVKEIYPGDVIKLRLHKSNVGQITALSVSTTGFLSADIKSATVGVYNPVKKSGDTVSYECTGWYSFDCNRIVTNETCRFTVSSDKKDSSETLSTVNMNIKTLKTYTAESGSFGTDVGLAKGKSLEMTVFYEEDGELKTMVFKDITKNLVAGDFSAGNTAEYSFMAKNITAENFKKVEFRPYDSDETTNIVWGLDTIDISFISGTADNSTIHVEPRKVMYENGTNESVSFAKVIISGTVEKIETELDEENDKLITSVLSGQELGTVTQTSGKTIYLDNYSPMHIYKVSVNIENSSLGYKLGDNRGFVFYSVDDPEDKNIYFSIDAKGEKKKVFKIESEENPDCFLEISFAIESNVEYEMSAEIEEVEVEYEDEFSETVISDTFVKTMGHADQKNNDYISIKDHSGDKMYKVKLDLEESASGYDIVPERGIKLYYPKKDDEGKPDDILYVTVDAKVGEQRRLKIVSKENEDCLLNIIFAVEAKEELNISAAVSEVNASITGNMVSNATVISSLGAVGMMSGNVINIKEHTPEKVYQIAVDMGKSTFGYKVKADDEFIRYQSEDDMLYVSIDGRAGETKTVRIISEDNEASYLNILFVIEAEETAPETIEETTEVIPVETTEVIVDIPVETSGEEV